MKSLVPSLEREKSVSDLDTRERGGGRREGRGVWGEHPGSQSTLRLSELRVCDVLGKDRSACVRAALG